MQRFKEVSLNAERHLKKSTTFFYNLSFQVELYFLAAH